MSSAIQLERYLDSVVVGGHPKLTPRAVRSEREAGDQPLPINQVLVCLHPNQNTHHTKG
jgi:hypothetical protein